jgi:diadenylate cyclase
MIGNFIQFILSGGVRLIDILDVIIVAIIIYALIARLKGTRAVQIIGGIFVFFSIFILSDILELRTLNWLLRYFSTSAVLIAIILFAPEIRSFFVNITRNPVFNLFSRPREVEDTIEDLILAVDSMADKRMGGIILIEKKVGLRNYIEAGIRTDAYLSYDLLLTIFNPSSPLHDGAVIIREDRIVAAACFLPLTLNPRLSRELGTRHRAAIGISEETDAIVIIVSEERGEISIAYQGDITKPLTIKNLTKLIFSLLEDVENTEEIIKKFRRPGAKTIKRNKKG